MNYFDLEDGTSLEIKKRQIKMLQESEREELILDEKSEFLSNMHPLYSQNGPPLDPPTFRLAYSTW